MTDSHTGYGDLFNEKIPIFEKRLYRGSRIALVVGENQFNFVVVFIFLRNRTHCSAPLKQTHTPPSMSGFHQRRPPMFLKCSCLRGESIANSALWKLMGLPVDFLCAFAGLSNQNLLPFPIAERFAAMPTHKCAHAPFGRKTENAEINPGLAGHTMRQASAKAISITMHLATCKLQGVRFGECDLERFH